jgi:peptidoglycan/LPS O-acetylase OafA/YrhL
MLKPSRLDHLDLLRGLAAFLVLAGHLRAYIFQSFLDLDKAGAQLSAFAKAFYFATGLGHQAVMIFFALSGFLVGGKALNDILAYRFSWSRYLLRRLTRLWIVIVPALLLTLLLDRIGSELTSGVGYDGRYYDLYFEGPRAPAGVDHSMLAFFGNLAFLQTIYAPTFGSNGPMWSLANEFWYYIVFPLIGWIVLARVSWVGRSAALSILLTLIFLLPVLLLEGGVIWVVGAASAWCSRQQPFERLLRHIALRIGAVLVFVAALISSKTPAIGIGDLELGLAMALILPIFAHMPSPGGTYSSAARRSSEISYTLYLTHFPFLTMIVMVGIAPMRWPPSLEAAGIYAALLSAATAWAAIVWWCFERNTDSVYDTLSSKLPSPENVSVRAQ